MTTAVTEPETPTTTAPVADAEKSGDELFKWSRWVHVGEGAEACPQAKTGKCSTREHFHAWVRLPNPFQIRDITEKASAARARRHRMMRDLDSDARVILEDELDVLRDSDKTILADEIVEQDFSEDYVRAVQAVDDMDDPDHVPESEDEKVRKLYVDIDQDREEYERQKDLPEEQRTEDFLMIEQRVADYSRAIDEEMEKVRAPRLDALLDRDMEDLVGIVRRKRIEEQGNEAYLHWFNTWQWYSCTFKPAGDKQPHERVWSDINQMRLLGDTGVILHIQGAFAELESQLARTRSGKGV